MITTGNTCVVLTSATMPLPAVTLAEVLATSDVPGGVVNILTGTVSEVAPHLAAHMDVNAIDLTGAGLAAADLEVSAADNVKRVLRPVADPDGQSRTGPRSPTSGACALSSRPRPSGTRSVSEPPSGAATAAESCQRAVADLAQQCRLRAGLVVEGPPGLVGVFDADWPVSHTSNRVVVTGDLPHDLGAAAVLSFVDDAFSGRGLTHRKVDVLDDAVGRRLTDDLVAAGFDASPVLLMVATTTPTPSPGVIVVEVVDEVEMAGLVEKGWQLTAPDFTAETVRQLVDRRAAAPRAADIVRLAVRDPASGALASKADLLLRGDTAEIDDVLTLPDHRGRGYASAIVLDAVARARRAGADLVFLEAAEDDWPKDLYVRLGFETVGRIHEFSRLDVDATP